MQSKNNVTEFLLVGPECEVTCDLEIDGQPWGIRVTAARLQGDGGIYIDAIQFVSPDGRSFVARPKEYYSDMNALVIGFAEGVAEDVVALLDPHVGPIARAAIERATVDLAHIPAGRPFSAADMQRMRIERALFGRRRGEV